MDPLEEQEEEAVLGAEEDDLDLDLDDLAALQDELDTLRQALGDRYQQLGDEGKAQGGDEGTAPVQHGRSSAPPSPTLADGGGGGLAGVAAIYAALEANQRLQARLRRLLESIGRAQNRNADLAAELRGFRAHQQAAAPVAGPSAAAPPALPAKTSTAARRGEPWFWQLQGLAPAPHADAAGLRAALRVLPLTFPRATWTEEEQGRLRSSALQLAQEVLLNAGISELQELLEAGGAVTREDIEESTARVKDMTLDTPELAGLVEAFGDEEWETAAARSILRRSTAECRQQWANVLRPGLAQGAFTPREDESLLQLVEQHGGQGKWEEIARGLGTGRTALACLSRHRALAAQARPAPALAPRDVPRLEAAVKRYGLIWRDVAEAMGGAWEPAQLMHLWRRHAQRSHPTCEPRTGKWEGWEDAELQKAVALHGRKWSRVAGLVPGRSDVQCRERWVNILDPDARRGDFTPEEEEALRAAVATHTSSGPGGRIKWSAVANAVRGRSHTACAAQWKQMRRREARGGAAAARPPKALRLAKQAKQAGQRKRRKPGGRGSGTLPAAEPPVYLTAEDLVDGDETETESEPEPGSEEEEEGASGARALPKRAKREMVQIVEEVAGAPAATAQVMPCHAVSAVGRSVWVWWLAEGAKEGAMYLATVAGFNRRTGMHTLRYASDDSCMKHTLREETVDWGEGVVTGPGAAWPE